MFNQKQSKLDIVLHFVNMVVAVSTSVIQTNKIIKEIKLRNPDRRDR